MRDDDTILTEQKKKAVLSALGRVVHARRTMQRKGINKFSFEYDIGNGLLSRIENGSTDTKITTLWKLANAFGLKFSKFAELIENELSEGFNFYD